MAANDAEAPAFQAAAGDEAEKPEASVGVMGWLGFIIINFAAWGIIGVSWEIVWVLGFVMCACYTVALIGLAVFFERRDPVKFHQFLNLLWVLAATFVCVTGMFIAVQLIGQLGRDDAGASPTPSPFVGKPQPPPVSSLLPDNASTALREWAIVDPTWETLDKTDYSVFGGSLFFHGHDNSTGRSVLLRSAGGHISRLAPAVSDGQGFVENQSNLYFFTRYPSQVYRVDAGDLDTIAVAFAVSTGWIKELFVDSSTLYVKATWKCDCNYHDALTLLRSDGTDAGTVDLREDQRSTYCGCDGAGDDWPPNGDRDLFNRVSLWSALLVAVLPMMALAGFVMVKKQLPGLVVNLYIGVEAVAIIVYFLITFDNEDERHFADFLKVFLTAYNSLLWVLLAAWSLAQYKLPNWEESRQEELKSWAVALVGVSFFVMLHIVTEIPWTDTPGRWICYAVLTIVQMLLSAIVSRTVPMVTGAIGLFILAWKVSFELVVATGIDDSEFGTLVLLAIMALQGLAIIAGAIFYASNREKIEGAVSALLRCDRAALKEMGARPFGDIGA